MVGNTFRQIFFGVKVVTFGPTVSPGIADVMPFGRALPRVPTGHIPESESMVGTTFIQMFFRVEVVAFGPTVSLGISDVIPMEEHSLGFQNLTPL